MIGKLTIHNSIIKIKSYYRPKLVKSPLFHPKEVKVQAIMARIPPPNIGQSCYI